MNSMKMPGPINEAQECQQVYEFWEVLLSAEIRELIVYYTNLKIESVQEKMRNQNISLQSYHLITDFTEIDAFLGLLYYAGVWKSHRVAVKEMWSNDQGNNIYRSTMSVRRFNFLSQCLRFDDKSKRSKEFRFGCIEEIWKTFIDNCRRNYEPSDSCTVDEQLLGFRGNCSFRVYIKNKPARYGLKLVTLNDAKTFYLVFFVSYDKIMNIIRIVNYYKIVFLDKRHPLYREAM